MAPSPTHPRTGFEAQLVDLTGCFAEAHGVPAEIGIESCGTCLGVSAQSQVIRVLRSACAAASATDSLVALRIGVGIWSGVVSAVVRAEALRAEHREPAPGWGLVRDRVDELGGVLDLSGLTASIVLPVHSTTRRRDNFVLPFDAVALGREGVDPESTASCLSGAAKRLGLSEEACERLVSRSLLVGVGQPPLATPSFLQAEPERVTLHTAEKGDHALFVTETSTRVIAFWEPIRRRPSVDARPLVAGAA